MSSPSQWWLNHCQAFLSVLLEGPASSRRLRSNMLYYTNSKTIFWVMQFSWRGQRYKVKGYIAMKSLRRWLYVRFCKIIWGRFKRRVRSRGRWITGVGRTERWDTSPSLSKWLAFLLGTVTEDVKNIGWDFSLLAVTHHFPVSYTHLDVYKRQRHTNAPNGIHLR